MRTNGSHLRSIILISFAATSYALLGCASIEPVPVTGFESPGGIPYYDGSHYLLVYPDGKGNLKWSLHYLADPTKKRVFRSENILSSVNATLEFSNGLLTKADTTVDASAVPKALVGAIEKVITAGVANDLAKGTNEVPGPLIYKLEVRGDVIHVIGQTSEQAIVKVRVTSPPKEDEEEDK